MDEQKEKKESLWDTFVNFGIGKALGLVWIIYIFCAVIAMIIVDWFTKHK